MSISFIKKSTLVCSYDNLKITFFMHIKISKNIEIEILLTKHIDPLKIAHRDASTVQSDAKKKQNEEQKKCHACTSTGVSDHHDSSSVETYG